jgi:hypothetical protein
LKEKIGAWNLLFWERACAADLLFKGEDRCLGLVVLGKVCAEDLLFEGEDRCLGLVVLGFCQQLHIPNSTGSFKLDRRETGTTEVCVSSLDIVGSNLFQGNVSPTVQGVSS